MEQAARITQLREMTGMNRTEFCQHYGISYRTVTEWERGVRHAPDYVVRLLEYYIRMERYLSSQNESQKEAVSMGELSGKAKMLQTMMLQKQISFEEACAQACVSPDEQSLLATVLEQMPEL